MIPYAYIVRDFSAWLGPGNTDVDESLDLTAAALEEDDAVMERSRLLTRGFKHGRTVRWISDDGVVISLTVHELASITEAQLSVADHRETLRAAAALIEVVTSDHVAARMNDEGDELFVLSHAVGQFHVVLATRGLAGQIQASALQQIADRQADLLASN